MVLGATLTNEVTIGTGLASLEELLFAAFVTHSTCHVVSSVHFDENQ